VNICHLTSDSAKGGIEKHLLDLSTEQSRYTQVSLLGPNNLTAQASEEVIKIPFNWKLSRHNPLLALNLLAVLKKNNFDLIHCHGEKAYVVVNKIRHFLGLPIVATIHNARKKRSSSFKNADLIIGVSQSALSTIPKNPNQLRRVIYNGIDPHFKSKKINTEFPIAIDKLTRPIICGIGRLVEAKGFDRLIRVAHKLNFQLIIIGEGPLKTSLLDLAAQLDFDQSVHFLGHRNEVSEILSLVDACLITSYAEGFSYVALEALFSKTLIASTNVACMEFLPDYVLLPNSVDQMANKISFLFNDIDRWKKSLSISYEFALKNLTTQSMAIKTLSTYKELLNKKPN